MTCTASLTAVIYQVLRHYLMQNEGLPLGLLGAGLSFSQISYLWSAEFCLSVKACGWRKWPLLLLLIVAALIAATIGPSIAVLILPRFQTIPIGGTTNYLNATVDQLWPVHINSSEYFACSLPNATLYDVCPSGGYFSLLHTFRAFTYQNFRAGEPSVQPRLCVLDAPPGYFSFQVQSDSSILPVTVSAGQLRDRVDAGTPYTGTYACQPPAVVTTQQQVIFQSWYESSTALAGYDVPLSSISEYHYHTRVTSR